MEINDKRIIFHLPDYVDFDNPKSGSHLRPTMLIKTFQSLGYEVDVITGYGKQRRVKINKVIRNIELGIKYDFVYSESSTTPTLLTETHHLPIYPFLEYKLFRLCKKNNLKIGVFYRDIYWQFDLFKKELGLIKYWLMRFFYFIDLLIYKKFIDVLFLPSIKMKSYIPVKFNCLVESLPPGICLRELSNMKRDFTHKICILYVGGVGDLYRIDKLLDIACDNVEVSICCRELEWLENKGYYEKYLNKTNVKVFHKSGAELDELYENADIVSLFIEPSEYRSFSMPVKFFEYLSFYKPIIAVDNTVVGDFVEKYNIGWCIEYSIDALQNVINEINNNPSVLENKIRNIHNVYQENSWESRVKFIESKLFNI